MGAAYYIVLERDIDNFDPSVNGKAVARDAVGLSKLAEAADIPDINEFVSASPEDLEAMAEDLGFDLTGDLPEAPPEHWFKADEGLAWLARIRQEASSNSALLKHNDAVMDELEEYRTVLEVAKSNNVGWHFAVDY